MDCATFKAWLVSPHSDHDPDPHDALAHTAVCPECRKLWQTDTVLERQLQGSFSTTDVPENLTARMRTALAQSPSPPPLSRISVPWWKWLTPALAATAALLFLVFNPLTGKLSSMDAIGKYALINHEYPEEPLGVTSSQMDVVGKWFNDRMPFQITVPDLRQRGYALKGGRPCTLGRTKAVYLVYDDQGERVSTFVVPSQDVAFAMTKGRHYQMKDATHLVEFWRENDVVCVLVRKSPEATATDV